MAEWGNFKVPIQTHYDARVIEIYDLEETKKGDAKLEIKCVHNWYDSDEEDNQGSFWFRCLFTGDTAERHFNNLSKGDTVLIKPTSPLQTSTTDESEFVNFKFAFPQVKYLKIANWGNDDEGDDEPEEKPKTRSRQNRSSRKKKKKSFFGSKQE